VDNAALRALLVRASAFVLPSVEDGFAQAPLEAMACGLPPIVTENVGMSDGITDGTDGFVIPAFDADAIAEKIEALYVDRGLANSMGQAAAATAHASGSWAHYADRVIARHRSLVVQTSASTREAA
jgi:glycosyltransferase involved in cell wall biosynthesis